MSTSTKTPASIRHGGPGASHQDASDPVKIDKKAAEETRRGNVSGGGGEHDSHHTHEPTRKGKG